jgi:hypothetical protein
MSIQTITKDGQRLAMLIPDHAWQEGLAFYSEDDDYIQVGTWGYDAGKELLAHVHNAIERTVIRTQEVLYIRRGKIQAKIYDLDGCFVEEIMAQAGDTLILLNSGHGYTILEDGTQVLEVKNGPYLGAQADRTRIEVPN